MCATYIDPAVSKIYASLLKILARCDLVNTMLRVHDQIVGSRLLNLFIFFKSVQTILAVDVVSCLEKSEANRSDLCCFQKKEGVKLTLINDGAP